MTASERSAVSSKRAGDKPVLRRLFVFSGVLVTVLLLTQSVTQAQQPTKIPRIGFLPSAGDAGSPGTQVKAFQLGLRDLGYIEGKNILIEYRYGEGQAERIPSLVAELVQLKVDVLVVGSPGAVQEAKKASRTIPIVFVITQDPVAAGYVDSLARPGGNITGITRLTRDLSEKRLELLKEAVPTISRVGVIWSGAGSGFKRYEAAARTLKIPLYSLEVRSPKPDFEGAFQAAKKAGANALVTVTNIRISAYLKRIAELANANRLPSMFERSEYVEAGGLISYGASDKLFRRAAIYVDKILKGASPANLPVEQPTKFELVINLKTAKQIGFTIPPNILARADRVIR
jgi:putative tryptophan/tyrosine transport system substrate-binding protein